MPRVTLSYRRSDSPALVRLIYERLRAHYGSDSVFMDIDSIPFGVDFRQYVDSALKRTDFLLTLIGPGWLGVDSSGVSRLMRAGDNVRLELESAFAQNLVVIPVLLEDAPMPNPDVLPTSLASLSYINAAEITSGRDFDTHINRLIAFIDRRYAETQRLEKEAQLLAVAQQAEETQRIAQTQRAEEQARKDEARRLEAARLAEVNAKWMQQRKATEALQAPASIESAALPPPANTIRPRARPLSSGVVAAILVTPLVAIILLALATVQFSRSILGYGQPASSLTARLYPADGRPVDGIQCDRLEGTIVHSHQHLWLFNHGVSVRIPGNVGRPRCLYWIHTLTPSGIIHIESPVVRTFTLGDFFDIWGQPLSPEHAGPLRSDHLRVLVDGLSYDGDPRAIALKQHTDIVIEAGPPWPTPYPFTDWQRP